MYVLNHDVVHLLIIVPNDLGNCTIQLDVRMKTIFVCDTLPVRKELRLGNMALGEIWVQFCGETVPVGSYVGATSLE